MKWRKFLPQFNRVIEVEFPELGINLDANQIRIDFSVNKSDKSTSNQAVIRLYNLNSNTFNLINQLNTTVRLSAGYTDESGAVTIFIGDITKINRTNSYPDVITTIHALDGIKSINNIRSTFSFSQANRITSAIQSIADKLNLPVTLELGTSINGNRTRFRRGFAYVGQASKALTKVTNSIGSTWNIENGELIILPKRKARNLPPIELERGLGLLAQPQPLQDVEGKLPNEISKRGYSLKMNLTPDFLINIAVMSRIPLVTGEFRVVELKHFGSNFESDFNTDIDIVEL